MFSSYAFALSFRGPYTNSEQLGQYLGFMCQS